MRKRPTAVRLGVAAALSALPLMAAFGGGSAAADSGAAVKSACTPATNVQAIIDDSGSMSSNDPDKFRTKLLTAFASISENNGLIFGGGEFGDAYNPLFGPATIPGVNASMQASFVQVDANSGGTDYEVAFTGATAQNGTANARIFLSDGEPNFDPNPNVWRNPNVPTYVIALGQDFVSDSTAQVLLNQIASDTGGPPPTLVTDASQLQPVAASITAQLHCKQPPLTFSKVFTRQGQAVNYGFKPQGHTADILLSWGNAGTILDGIGFTY
ncbi:MAG: vWA domain-containing protein, partial [Solirubrobacterales bacterium]